MVAGYEPADAEVTEVTEVQALFGGVGGDAYWFTIGHVVF